MGTRLADIAVPLLHDRDQDPEDDYPDHPGDEEDAPDHKPNQPSTRTR
jgi:hypothetical protein